MMMTATVESAPGSQRQAARSGGEEFGLIIQQSGEHGEQTIVKSLCLILNYLYGFNIILARTIAEATGLIAQRGGIRHVFAVWDKPISEADMVALGSGGEERPLFCSCHNCSSRRTSRLYVVESMYICSPGKRYPVTGVRACGDGSRTFSRSAVSAVSSIVRTSSRTVFCNNGSRSAWPISTLCRPCQKSSCGLSR